MLARTVILVGALALLSTSCGDGAVPTSPAVTLANLNLVHGLFCPPASENCRLSDRVGLTFEFVVASGCPDVVTLQEIWPPSLEQIRERARGTCPFPYEVVHGPNLTGVDDEVVLSRYPVIRIEQEPLFPGFRRALLTRIDHPAGPLDVYSTHLAAGVDGGPDPCGENCPAECAASGAATIRECQAVQMAAFVDRTHDVPNAALLSGDFNARPDSAVYRTFTDRSWTDTYLAAGNPECEPATGLGCTSGRASEDLQDLESPEIGLRSRIDFIFLVPPGNPAVCQPVLRPADGLGPGTQLWADVPNPFQGSCGPEPAAPCWASDHTGVQVAFDCT